MNFSSPFQNDPFFSGLDLSHSMALEHRSRNSTNNRPSNDQRMEIFSNPFAFMQNMINQMESHTNGQGVSFSSSTIMSMDRRNEGQPRIIQATSEQLRGPEGFARTRKAVRDTGRNLEKMEIAHRLGERGHRIIKERDPTTGHLLENREFEHIENENEFEREWFNRAEKYGLKSTNGYGFNSQTNHLLTTPPSFPRPLRSQSQEPRRLAIEHSSDRRKK